MKNYKFINHTGIVCPLDIDNVDTDAIIPKQFLQQVTKKNLGKYLFFNWRFLNQEKKQKNPNFVLNQNPYLNSSILLTRSNFGCGSSREHAVWAIVDYGIKVIIASSFADIFYNNSINNNLLLITLNKQLIDTLFHIVTQNVCKKFFIDLLNKTILINNQKYLFNINQFYRDTLLKGLDFIDLTLKKESYITNYESTMINFY